MALKDWKREKNKYMSGIVYKGKKYFISIQKANNLGKNMYFVSFANLDGTFRTDTPNTKVFINKSEALKYAKEYMRKHPSGQQKNKPQYNMGTISKFYGYKK